jgi:hypothetical protein
MHFAYLRRKNATDAGVDVLIRRFSLTLQREEYLIIMVMMIMEVRRC